ncbi:hypothetical protein FW754_15445 [Acinetobacter sp. 1207_04]|uniref:hypothetical protein n=1 Tax=Acinetobacter sp. 1207_04 TaxID=2604449 RepID=UPI004058B257
MKKLLLAFSVIISTSSFAGLPEMMKVYNNPSSAPKVAACKGNVKCNAFTALAKQWQAIPNNYRYHGFDIKDQARQGDGYGLNKGFSLSQDKSISLSEAGDAVYYDGGGKGAANERIFGQGLAVLLYIEGKNGWDN